MTVAARSVCNLLMCAMVTLLHLSAKRGGTACAEVSECLALLRRQYVSPAIQKLLTVLAEDIGDFQPMFGHGRGVSCSSARGESGSASNGL